MDSLHENWIMSRYSESKPQLTFIHWIASPQPNSATLGKNKLFDNAILGPKTATPMLSRRIISH